MKPWMIVLASTVGAIIVTAAIAVPEVRSLPRSDLAPVLLAHSPVLAIAALAVYALCAILLTTASLVTGALRFRNYLMRTSEDQHSTARQWGAVLSNQFQQLATRLTYAGATDHGVAFASFSDSDARREIARLYYISLARSHFPSALVVLAGIVSLGLAQGHGSLPLQPAAIPTASAALIMAGLALLYVLGRIAVDVTAEPLLETISQLRISESIEVGLLRRAVELLEIAGNTPSSDSQSATPSAELAERIVDAIEQSQHLLSDAVSRLSATTEALEAAIRASVEALETAIHAPAAQPIAADGHEAAGAGFPELQTAVEELTAVLRQLSAVPEGPTTDLARAPDRPPERRLAGELRQLLQEIESAR
jgi:hypothetical protein